MRKLASIQKIKSLAPIPDADAIEKASVLGWELVVKKGEFKVGDLCVYCEIDCLMPDRPEFEFLKARGMRIRTIRLRGQISQGICFPLSVLPPEVAIEEDREVTQELGITKYEPPIPASLSGEVKGGFPGFMPKTDETRVQILQDLLTRYKGVKCYVTEKLDGSSVTYYYRDGEFGVCSRNLELKETAGNTLWKLAHELKIEEKLKARGQNVALQGEIIGESIQSNKYNLRGQKVFFFNLFDIDGFKYLDFEDFITTFKELELETVPVLDTDFELIDDVHALVEMSVGKSVLYNVRREGLVIRPLKEDVVDNSRVSFKAINPEFLLKYE